jgi:hypothetical protein
MNIHMRFRKTLQVLMALAITCLSVTGCETTSTQRQMFRLSESTLEIREMQTRTFAASSEVQILAATAAALQDMEYNIDQIETPLGVITATKVSDADNAGEQFGRGLLDLLCGCGMSQDSADKHAITITTVVLPSLARSGEYVTRITIQQITYNKMSQVIAKGAIDDPASYQKIFERLSKALYVEVNDHA